MTTEFNYVTCPKCGHDRNPSTLQKCEICGQPLKKGGVPPIVWLVLAGLVLLAGAYFLFKDRLGGTDPVATVSTPAETTQAPPKPSDPSLISSATPVFYKTLAEVPNVPRGTVNYGGSTTFAPLRSNTVVSAISKAHPDFRLRYVEPGSAKPGSGTGIKSLIAGELSFAQSSRPLKDSEYAQAKERGFALEQIPVAIDGIALFANRQLQLPGLSLAQLRDIFTGKITNWKAVGGPDLKIVPFSRNLQAGGTVDFFRETVLEEGALGQGVREVRDTTDALRKVASTPGGISYATASEVIGQKTVRPLPLSRGTNQTVAPFSDDANTQVNKAAFANGSYPITRRLFVVVRRDGKLDEQAGVAYANLLLTDEGQRLVEGSGFVSIR